MAELGNLLPLIVLLVLVGGGGFVGYHIYLWSNELADRGKRKMEKKNMSFTKDGGLRVGVKAMGEESYTDKTQKYAFPAPYHPPTLYTADILTVLRSVSWSTYGTTPPSRIIPRD
jgi:hypothetical protein